MENEITENEDKKQQKSGYVWKFMIVFIFTCLSAAGLFLLWAWISYNKRYSAELIRAGLVLIYMIPCLLGGRMIRFLADGKRLLWGAGLGTCYFAAVLLLSFLVKGTALQIDKLRAAPLILCVVCGIAGTLRLHRIREDDGEKDIP